MQRVGGGKRQRDISKDHARRPHGLTYAELASEDDEINMSTTLARDLAAVSLAATYSLCSQCSRRVLIARLIQLPDCHHYCAQCRALSATLEPPTEDQEPAPAPSDGPHFLRTTIPILCLRCGLINYCLPELQPTTTSLRTAPTSTPSRLTSPSSSASRRVMREFRQATSDGIGTRFNVKLVDGSLHHWRVTYDEPLVLILYVIFPPDYPSQPPQIRMVSPRRLDTSGLVDDNSNICLESLLRHEGGWSSRIHITPLLLSLEMQLTSGPPDMVESKQLSVADTVYQVSRNLFDRHFGQDVDDDAVMGMESEDDFRRL